ncbi:MAG TPA: hypothetical protein VIH03_08375 [Nitrososphaerales archaeon]
MTSRNSNKPLDGLLSKKAANDSKSIFVIEVRMACRFCTVIRLNIKGITRISARTY